MGRFATLKPFSLRGYRATNRVDIMNGDEPLRVAMWSGPRNISTAMMRAWENRPDTFVCDEPLYAHYLHHTGLPHPVADEIIASLETDWRKVVQGLTSDVPGGKRIFYQKQMTHHFLAHLDRAWLGRLTNCFLIRDPGEVITSYLRILPEPTLEDLGLPQQTEIFRWVRDHTGAVPPVLDAKDVLEDPESMLRSLCDAIGVDFTPRMLAWPPGPRSTDGIWTEHWYHNVKRSTGFAPYRPKGAPVPNRFRALHEACLEYYRELYEYRLGQ